MPRLAVRFVLLVSAVVEVLVRQMQHRIIEVERRAEEEGPVGEENGLWEH